MIKEINRDIFLLSQKSAPATENDRQTGEDLLETLIANSERCVGMAANMIGILKNIIAINDNGDYILMYNPEIIKSDGAYETEEGCLSLSGIRKTTRYENIEVEYQDFSWKKQRQKLSGWTAQIVQHEVDHCNGILI